LSSYASVAERDKWRESERAREKESLTIETHQMNQWRKDQKRLPYASIAISERERDSETEKEREWVQEREEREERERERGCHDTNTPGE